MGRATANCFLPRPGPGEGSNGQISLIFNNKVNFKDLYTNERYKTYQTGFLFCRLGHTLGVGLGPKLNSVWQSVRYAISSLPIVPNSTKFGL